MADVLGAMVALFLICLFLVVIALGVGNNDARDTRYMVEQQQATERARIEAQQRIQAEAERTERQSIRSNAFSKNWEVAMVGIVAILAVVSIGGGLLWSQNKQAQRTQELLANVYAPIVQQLPAPPAIEPQQLGLLQDSPNYFIVSNPDGTYNVTDKRTNEVKRITVSEPQPQYKQIEVGQWT